MGLKMRLPKTNFPSKNGQSVCLNVLFPLISVLTGASTSGYEERGNTDPQTQTQEPQQDPTRWALQLRLKTHHSGFSQCLSGSLGLCRASGRWGDSRHSEQHSPDLCRLRGASPHQDGAGHSQLVHTPQRARTGGTPCGGESLPSLFSQTHHRHVCFDSFLQISALPAYMTTHGGAIPLKMSPGGHSGSSGSKAEPWNNLILA